MWTLRHDSGEYHVRVATGADAAALRALLNAAYGELAAVGLNYTASYQDEAETRNQIESGVVYVMSAGGEIVGTIGMREENKIDQRRSAYLGKFGVRPERKRAGLGSLLIGFAERQASAAGYECVQLDTAKPATHLVDWYRRLGYLIVGETRFPGKTYESWIFAKALRGENAFQPFGRS